MTEGHHIRISVTFLVQRDCAVIAARAHMRHVGTRAVFALGCISNHVLTSSDIVEIDDNVLIPIAPRYFVIEAQRMHNFMLDVAIFSHAAWHKGNALFTPLVPDTGETPGRH